MLKIAPALILMAALFQRQAFSGMLLPEAVHIVGAVSDEGGKPIAGARIDHTGELLQDHQRDADGRLDLLTRAPAVVIRKDGFRGVLVRTQQAAKNTLRSEEPCTTGRSQPARAGGGLASDRGW